MLLYSCTSSETYTVHLSRDDNEKAFYCTAYKNIIDFIPDLKKYIAATKDGDSELYKLLEIVSCAHESR